MQPVEVPSCVKKLKQPLPFDCRVFGGHLHHRELHRARGTRARPACRSSPGEKLLQEGWRHPVRADFELLQRTAGVQYGQGVERL